MKWVYFAYILTVKSTDKNKTETSYKKKKRVNVNKC